MKLLGMISAGVAATTLVGVGALHLAWSRGESWPMSSRAELASAVVGGAEVPSPAACTIVGVGLIGAGALVAGVGGDLAVARFARGGLAAGLAVRGVVDGVAISRMLDLPLSTPEFVKLDNMVYRPLCLTLAALVGVSAVSRARARSTRDKRGAKSY